MSTPDYRLSAHSDLQRNRVAILILHEVGQQARFETLASFAAGLAEAASAEHVRRTPIVIDDRLDSAITIAPPDVDVDVIAPANRTPVEPQQRESSQPFAPAV